MSEVALVVIQPVQPDRYEEAKAALGAIVEAVHANDEGCLLYALHGVPGDRSRLIMIEKWASQEALEAHIAQPHVARLADIDALDGPGEVNVVESLGYGDPAKAAL